MISSLDQLVMNFFDVIRLINVALASVIVILILRRYLIWRDDLRLRLIRLALMGVIVSNIIPSVALAMRGVPAGPRVIPFTVAIIWTFVAFFWDYLPGNRAGKVTDPRERRRDPLSRRL